MNNLKGIRIITNLHCNYKCRFCYQKDKVGKVLSLDTLKQAISTYFHKPFEYCTIMGGESTLLGYDLAQYISIANCLSSQVRLTTNGRLLTVPLMEFYKEAGLKGINISVATLDKYQETTGSDITNLEILNIIRQARKIFPSLRINIALCKANINGEIKKLIGMFLGLGINITICEDILETFSFVNCPEKMDAELVEDTGFGLLFFRHKPTGMKFGYYHHADNYKNTDLIVSPIGTFIAWDEFCKKVGYHVED